MITYCISETVLCMSVVVSGGEMTDVQDTKPDTFLSFHSPSLFSFDSFIY